MKGISLGSAFLLSFGWFVAAATAQEASLAVASGDLEVDAASYARHYGVDFKEALRRLELQAEIGALDALLEKQGPPSFAGLWIENGPEYEVRVRFTKPAQGREFLAERQSEEVASLVRILPARWSLAELQAALEQTALDLRAEGIDADLHINVRENRVELFTVQPESVERAFALSDKRLAENVTVIGVAQLVQPDMVVQGGRPIADFGAGTLCSSAFVVRSSGGELGVTTAGHCHNNQTNEDDFTPLTFRAEDFEGNQDVQWHSGGCGVDFRNEFDSGSGIRNVTGSLGRSGQSVGSWVCKHGRSTGGTCGSIGSKSYCPSYVPNGKSTFVCVNPGDVPLSQPGDSGGPWFSGNTAYGVHSGGDGAGNLAIYMPIDYISSLGLTVLNYNAGTNPPSATVTCTGGWAGSQNISCYAQGYAGNPPYTFTGWSYYGSSPASSFSWSGSSASAQYSSGCAANSYQSFSVTVVDSCGRVGYGQSWFLCQPYY